MLGMKKIELIKPTLKEFIYEQKLQNNPKTMSYNAGYDVKYAGYHYDTGCIDFPKDKWPEVYHKRFNNNNYFAYIKDLTINKYVGYVNYQYNKDDNRYECGILIEYKYRHQGYAKEALRLLVKEAYQNGIEYLYDSFEKERDNTLNIFLSVGFEIYKETTWQKFNKPVTGVIVRINTKNIIQEISFSKLRSNEEDYQKLYHWCQNKDVYEWFEQRKLTYDEIVSKYHKKIKDPNQDLYIIRINNQDIGLIQIYRFNNDINISILDKYKKIYEYDLFIGEKDYLNKGYGKMVINSVNDIIYKKYQADAIILRPFKRNIRAIKCYQKCDFTKIHEYIGKDTLDKSETIIVLLNER